MQYATLLERVSSGVLNWITDPQRFGLCCEHAALALLGLRVQERVGRAGVVCVRPGEADQRTALSGSENMTPHLAAPSSMSRTTSATLTEGLVSQQVGEDFSPGLNSADVGMRDRLRVPRAGHEKHQRSGFGDAMSVLMAVLNKGMIRNPEGVLLVVKVKLVVRKTFSSQPAFRAFLGDGIPAGDQRNLVSRREPRECGFGAGDKLEFAAHLGVKQMKHFSKLGFRQAVGRIVVLSDIFFFQADAKPLQD
jgi:hypothetical protein